MASKTHAWCSASVRKVIGFLRCLPTRVGSFLTNGGTALKTTTLAVALFLLAVPAHAADEPAESAKEPPKTKLEAFEAKTGSVLIKGGTTIGTGNALYNSSVTVDAKEFIDASTAHREYGITITVKEAGKYEKERTAFVDYDEIDSLLKGLDYIGKIDASVTKLDRFEALYKTKGDLTFAVFSAREDINFGVTAGRISRATAFFKLANLPAFRAVIVNAKAKLDLIATPARGCTKDTDCPGKQVCVSGGCAAR